MSRPRLLRTTTIETGEDKQGSVNPDRPLLRVPHVILDEGELHAAVEKLVDEPLFVLDVETAEQHKDHPNPQTNEVTWIGLGGPGQVYLIPLRHPKGVTLVPEHRTKTPAYTLYGPEDPRAYTKTGKPSMAMKDHTVPAVYAKPPKLLNPDMVFAALMPLLFSDRAKLGHNVKFDLQTIAKYYGGVIPPGPYHDTILVRHTLEEELDSYELKLLTCNRYNVPHKERKTYYPDLGRQGVHNFGLNEVAKYLAKDLRYTWLMFHAYMPRLIRKGLKPIYDFEMSLYPILMEVESTGFPVDRSALGNVRKDLEQRIAEVEKQAWIMAGDEFQLSHTESKRWVLFGESSKRDRRGNFIPIYGQSKLPLRSQNLKVLARTPVEQVPQVTQAVLEHYADRNPMARFLLEWSVLEKLRGTFIEGLDGLLVPTKELPRIHTSFKQHGTVTGRLSSASPNLQQLPRGSTIRDLFVAGSGNVLIVADYDQIELRCAAYESGDREMARVFREGHDIHAEAAAAMFNLPVEQVTEELRQVGKTQNFGTLYGAAEDKVAAVAGVNKQRAAYFIRRYYQQFSGLLPWKRKVLAQARDRGDPANRILDPPYVTIPPIGRLRRLPDLYNPEDWKRWRAERQAINALIQGFASYITKLAMISLNQDLRPYPARMVVQVHDEIVVQVAESYIDDVLPVVVGGMDGIRTNGAPILGKIPLVVSAKVGYTWAEAKTAKKAAVTP
jgi:DNA polymerase I-like protein with 3'-5' exonuclease and polymerase domains